MYKGPKHRRNSEEAWGAGAEKMPSAWQSWLDPQAWVPPDPVPQAFAFSALTIMVHLNRGLSFGI